MIDKLKTLLKEAENAGYCDAAYTILNSGIWEIVENAEENDQDVPLNWLTSAFIFANAIGNLLPEGKGIVVRLQNDMEKLWNRDGDGAINVVVFCDGGEVKIEKTKDHFEGGEIIDVFIVNQN